MSRHSVRRMFFVLAWAAWAAWAAAGSSASSAQSAGASGEFRPDTGAWVVMGANATVASTKEAAWSQGGRPALDYRYGVGKGLVSLITLPIAGGALSKAGTLAFQARSSHLTNLLLSLEEQGGGRWTAPILLNANQWRNVALPLSELVLSTGGDAPPDANGKLDLDRVQRMSVVDAGAMLASGSEDVMRLFGIEAGPRRLSMSDVVFGGEPAAVNAGSTSGGTASLDGFSAAVPPWSVFGAIGAEANAAAPLTKPGLAVDYRKQSGAVLGLIRAVPPGMLAGGDSVELSLASRVKVSMLLKLEQSDGGKFETGFDVPGGGALQTVRLKLADFRRSDDSGSKDRKPVPARVSNLMLLDIGGLFASKTENRLWLQRVAVAGTSTDMAGAAPAAALPAAAPAITSVEVPGWSRWSKRVMPVMSGPFSLVGDPSVIRDGAILRMYYSCFDTRRKGPAICQATSGNGIDWADVPVKGPVPGRMIETREGKWDDTHETPYMLKFRGEYLLYFSGYRDRGGHFKSFPLQLGLASSKDGVNFERVGDEPIVKVSPGGYDSDAVFSPTIVEHEGQLVMLYTAYCLDSCKREKGVYLMAATSTNGRDWVKREKPVMSKADLPKTKNGAAEAELVKGPDGKFYLFMTLLYGDDGHDIGVARSSTPFGPWEYAPDAIVKRSPGQFDDIGPIAPSVLIEGDRVRMWFHGFSKRKTIQIGYAEAPWPLK